MHTPLTQSAPAQPFVAHTPAIESGFPATAAEGESAAERDRLFVAMLRAFRSSGGLLRGDEVADLLSFHQGPEGCRSGVALLGRQIAARQVVSFEWRGERWMPLFQFTLADMSLRETVRDITSELAPIMDGWALANWYARPNAWLAQQTPVDAIKEDPASVLQAARAERFPKLA